MRAAAVTLVAALTLLGPEAPVGAARGGPVVQAKAAVLVDAASGRVLWSRGANARRPMASTTKIAAALVVLRRAHLAEEVVVSPAASGTGAADGAVSTVSLRPGEKLTVEDLLYALLLHSANDAAIALAEHVSGSVEEFVEIMNRTAVRLGASNTLFQNPHGLDEEDHYSSAADLALLARAALAHPVFRTIVASRVHSIPGRRLKNRNRLLGAYPGADGVKTGTTPAAGRTLVASARRGDESLIAVVMGTNVPEHDAGALLDYGFDSFDRITVLEQGELWGHATFGDGTTLGLIATQGVTLLISAGETPQVRYSPESGELVVDVGGRRAARTAAVPVCPASGCTRETIPPEPNFMTALWTVIGPVVRGAASMW